MRARQRRPQIDPFTSPRPLEMLERRVLLTGSVVINEIHYNPDVKTEAVEFIELTNPGDAPVDLSGATFSSGVSYTFPAGTSLPAGGYLVVSENPAAFQTKFGTTALGPWTGSLDNDGDTIQIDNAAGTKLDEVDYQGGFPWPTVGDAPGYSIELINPALDNSVGGNWRSRNTTATTDTTLVPSGSSWKYRKGTSAQAPTGTTWRNTSFSDTSWTTATALPIGYDSELTLPTTLSDMNGSYSTVYLRKTFTLTAAQVAAFSSLRLEAMYDDGFNVWINGSLGQIVNTPTENLSRTATASSERESAAFQTFTLDKSKLVAGTNVIAVQLANVSLSGSPDAFFDGRLIASSIPSGPTPGRANASLASNAAPAMRQVDVAPAQPAAGQPVTITTKVTDPNGVASVSLSYSVSDPGNYIAVTDAAYTNAANWTNVAMHDDGLNGDAAAGDGVFSVVLPGTLQVNRRLVRYRVTSTDALGASVTGPYADDPVQNFAYYVYNGVPSWTGAVQPGATGTNGTAVTYSGATLSSVPVIQLLTKKADHADAQHLPNTATSSYSGDNYLWSGTLVYNGVVYDNIHYRARGGVWRYAMGKNMWKFDFNNGHDFQPTDVFGNPYGVKWKKLNLGADIQQGDIGMRGEQGLFETLGFQLFNLAGVPAPNTMPMAFRIVENANETDTSGSTTSQFNGDFQGLYLGLEQPDGRFLDQHGLPDGNFYKMESGAGGGSLNNQGPTQPTDNSDLVAFANGLTSGATDQWIRDNVDLDSFYSFQAVVEMAHHLDIGFGKNYYYYHNPTTNKWSILPWDMDLTWYDNYGSNGSSGGRTPFYNAILAPASRTTFQKEYRNRVRELRDLLFNSGEIGKLADAYAALINPAGGGPTLAQADRAMWDYNPILASSYVNSSKAGQGRFYQGGSPTNDFAGMVARLKSFSLGQFSYIDTSVITPADDAAAPAKPTVSYTGPTGFPADHLTFASTGFTPGNTGGSFAAMQWRVSDVTTSTGTTPDLEVDPTWQSPVLTAFAPNVTVPTSAVVPGRQYRVRVRMQDSNGRWGHWSDAFALTAGAPTVDPANALRVTELMYHPANPTPAEQALGFTNSDDFEFIELTNVASATVDLSGVAFTDGIDFTFADGTTLAPGARIVVVAKQAAFQARYGTSIPIAGAYADKFNNAGEHVLVSGLAGQVVLEFTYDDPWYPTTDGQGPSLVAVDPAGPTANLSTAAGWRPSVVIGGTPTTADPSEQPVVQSVQVNDGAGQRSKVNNITVTFDRAVVPAAGAFSLVGRNGAGAGTVVTWSSATANALGASNVWTLSFSGAPVVGGSLADGIYDLTVVGAQVHAGFAAGTTMAADFGSKFHRLYSDADGDGDSDNFDLLQLRPTLLKPSTDPAYKWYFDYDASGTVDNLDVFQVRSRRSVVFQGY